MNETKISEFFKSRELPEDWEMKELSDCVELIIDYRGKTPKKLGSEWASSGFRALSAKNVKQGSIVQEDSIRYADKELYSKWMKDEVQKEDLLLTSEGPLGECLLWDSDEKIVLSQRLFGIRVNKNIVNPRYFYAYVSSPIFQEELRRRATGTTVQGIRQSELLRTAVILPPMNIQKYIGEAFYQFQHQIMLSQRENKTLEAIGQTVFERWFVDFEFPNEEGKPYKSSGGRMSYNEMLAKNIPVGWHVDGLGNHAIIKGRIGWKGLQVSEYVMEGPYIIGGQEFENGHVNWDKCSHVTERRYKESPEIMLKEKDILMTKDGTIGKLAYVDRLKERATVASHIHVIRSNSTVITQLYLLNHFKSGTFRRLVEGKISGSVVPALLQRDIVNMPIVLPAADVVQKFEPVVLAIQNRIDLNSQFSSVLDKMRNTLLPKLMSGKLRVPTSRKNMEKPHVQNTG